MRHSPFGRSIGCFRKHRDTCDAAPFSSTLVNATHFFLSAAVRIVEPFKRSGGDCASGGRARKLILFGQKDRYDSACDRWICWIGGMESEVVVIIIDFEEDLLPRDLDKPEIVLAERVIVLIKVVVSRDRDQNGLIKVDT
jgi:hypothetical protein